MIRIPPQTAAWGSAVGARDYVAAARIVPQGTSVTLTRLFLLVMLGTMRETKARPRKTVRAPRIRVPNNERALFTVENQKFVGVVQRLSLTGGSVILAQGPVADGTHATMDLSTVFGKITMQIEFLHTGAEGIPRAQAFQFVDMDEVSSRRFTAAIEQMKNSGFSDVDETDGSHGGASHTLNKIWSGIRRLSAGITRP